MAPIISLGTNEKQITGHRRVAKKEFKTFRLKQYKSVIGIVRFLQKLTVEKTLCRHLALSRKGLWRLSNSPAVHLGMNNKWFLE